MSRRLAGKVALVTGAGRGQGRSHAVHLAREGADVVLVDLCADIPSNNYRLATIEDLDQTARQIEKLERRAIAVRADVRDRDALKSAAARAVNELGGLDVVVANAGIAPLGASGTAMTFGDAFDVDFVGVVNTVRWPRFVALWRTRRPGLGAQATRWLSRSSSSTSGRWPNSWHRA